MHIFLVEYDDDLGENWRCDGAKRLLKGVTIALLEATCGSNLQGLKGRVAREVKALG